ncbi:GGDEF domain-containing protein [Weissella bombi]|uniref:Diguanylate cyclase (GGDEF) domain-containing protein n=1 Tax=Weissella bombi TaxID=1505725 RepID=A0A1C3YR12_9LACO|nr:GGDEF domain-containing protein [Weissella bombi]SCB72513.1 diguanylate cyclase (GGDEF) domain-containing protein [Weissella bombi]
MIDLFYLITIQLTAVLIMIGTIAVNYGLKALLNKAKDSFVMRRRLFWIRIIMPMAAIIITMLNLFKMNSYWVQLESISIEVAMMLYFIMLLHDRIYVRINNVIIVISFIVAVFQNFDTFVTPQGQIRLFISCVGLLSIILINIFTFFRQTFVTQWGPRSYIFIAPYLILCWMMFTVDSRITFGLFISQVLSSIGYMTIFLLLDRLIRQQWQLLSRLTNTDFLTGIGNRRAFEADLSVYHKKLVPWYLVMFDIDDFKKINDQYGHAMGDATLRMVSQIINDHIHTLKVEASFYRVGGEEFTLLFANVSSQQVLTIISDIQNMVNQLSITNANGESIKVTLSIGITQHDVTDTEELALYKRADKYLYQAKKSGKNLINYEGTNISSKNVDWK